MASEPRLFLSETELNALGEAATSGLVPVSVRDVAELRRKSRVDIKQN
jgi:hypothetical protein